MHTEAVQHIRIPWGQDILYTVDCILYVQLMIELPFGFSNQQYHLCETESGGLHTLDCPASQRRRAGA